MSEPDRFDAQAREALGPHLSEWAPWAVGHVAAALRAEHASALERAAQACQRCGGRGYFSSGAGGGTCPACAWLRALIPPAAAPAASPHAPYCCADAKAGGPDHSMDCPHFAIPPAPDLRGALVEAKEALEQIWAAIGDRLCGEGPLSKEYAHGVTRKVDAALAQIRFTLSIAAAPAAETAQGTDVDELRRELWQARAQIRDIEVCVQRLRAARAVPPKEPPAP